MKWMTSSLEMMLTTTMMMTLITKTTVDNNDGNDNRHDDNKHGDGSQSFNQSLTHSITRLTNLTIHSLDYLNSLTQLAH